MKIGVLGFGSMGKTHAYCVKNFPFFFDTDIDVQLVGVCTKNIENARRACERYGFEFYTDNEDDIIYSDKVCLTIASTEPDPKPEPEPDEDKSPKL